MNEHASKWLAASCVLLVVAGSGRAATADSAKAAGVCDGVRRCHQVAKVDVNGDATADPVGIARRGKDGAESGSVIVRVKVGPDEIVSARRKTSYWYGSPWQGAGHLDGEDGKDLVVGYTTGAHTLFFHGLTWRNGDLVTLNAPGHGHTWIIDGAFSIAYGWLHKGSWPEGKIRKRVALRDESGKFRGTVTAYRWKNGGWDRTKTKRFDQLSDKRAYSWAGFRVPGIRRYE